MTCSLSLKPVKPLEPQRPALAIGSPLPGDPRNGLERWAVHGATNATNSNLAKAHPTAAGVRSCAIPDLAREDCEFLDF